MAKTEISKLDIAEEHVETAILLIAMNASPRSAHLPVMAASEIVRAVAKYHKIELKLDLEKYIVPERITEWRKAERRAYNYFKHADRDAAEPYSGPSDGNLRTLNDLSLMQTIANLQGLGVTRQPFTMFAASIGLLYPNLADWSKILEDNPKLKPLYEEYVSKLDRHLLHQMVVAFFLHRDNELHHDVDLAVQAAPAWPL